VGRELRQKTIRKVVIFYQKSHAGSRGTWSDDEILDKEGGDANKNNSGDQERDLILVVPPGKTMKEKPVIGQNKVNVKKRNHHLGGVIRDGGKIGKDEHKKEMTQAAGLSKLKNKDDIGQQKSKSDDGFKA